MKVAIIQMQSSSQLESNLNKMKKFIEEAKSHGADLIVFPEMSYFTGKKEQVMSHLDKFGDCVRSFQSWAKEFGVFLVPGTLREPVSNGGEKYFNTLLCFDPQGKTIVHYRKIFLFQADLPHHRYEEGRFCEPGTETVVCNIAGIVFGFAVCFDLRFPELFRSLRKKGARAFVIPSAFTVPTGQSHWEILLRARAIENQAYVIAPDQTLVSGEGLEQFGHSMGIDPWGNVLSQQGQREGCEIVKLHLEKWLEAESKVSAWNCRNERLFPIA
jgi:predicted amidohydrolase